MKKKNDGVKAVGRVSAVIAMVVLILAATQSARVYLVARAQ